MTYDQMEAAINADADRALFQPSRPHCPKSKGRGPDAIWLMRQSVRHGHSGFAHQPKSECRMPDLGGKEIVALALRAHGHGIKAIGKRLGVSPLTYRNFLVKNGISPKLENPIVSARDASLSNQRNLLAEYVNQEICGHVRQERAYGRTIRKAYAVTQMDRYYANHEFNKAKVRAKALSIYHERKHEFVFAIKRLVRSRIAISLRKRRHRKTVSSMVYLGCSWEFYLCYIELTMREGMNWDNFGRGGWEIDHIVPLHTFDLTNTEQAKRAFHWSNTAPCWASDNRSRPKNGSDLMRIGAYLVAPYQLRNTPPHPAFRQPSAG